MANDFFNSNPFSPSYSTPPPQITTITPTKPTDDLTTPPVAPFTLFYLTITAPHTDSYTIHGPVKSFLHLLPEIKSIVSNSPSAIDKLEALVRIYDVWGDWEPNVDFETAGFKVFVVEGQRGTFTVLRVLREINESVWTSLPAPVYRVTSHGPLAHVSRNRPFAKRGIAGTSTFIGSFLDMEEARSKARAVLSELIHGQQGVTVTETWERGGLGGGLVMGMGAEMGWEVKVKYEDDVFMRVKEGLEREGREVSWRY